VVAFPFPIPLYSITQKDKTMDGAPTTSGSGGGGGPAPFLLKTYEMVDDSKTDEIVSWSSNKNSFVVWNPPEFARVLLPTYFKHNNFSSFIRQLNTYVCFLSAFDFDSLFCYFLNLGVSYILLLFCFCNSIALF
jgi:hypothetical protein